MQQVNRFSEFGNWILSNNIFAIALRKGLVQSNLDESFLYSAAEIKFAGTNFLGFSSCK